MKLKDKIAIVTGGAMGNGLWKEKVLQKYWEKLIKFDYTNKIDETVQRLREEVYDVDGY